MGRIVAITINTFREAVRDRVLHGVLGFGAAVLFFALALGQLSLNQDQRVVHDIGFAATSFFSVIVAVFLGSSLLYKEIERKTLYVILPKPISRTEFLLGKFFGIVLTAFVFVTLMGSVQFLVMSMQAGITLSKVGLVVGVLAALLGLAIWRIKDRTIIVVPWAVAALVLCAWLASATKIALGPAIAALVLMLGEVIVLTAVAMFFSAFSTPFLTGTLTLGVWLTGRLAGMMVSLSVKALGPTLKSILLGVAEVVPNLNLFVPTRHTLEALGGGLWPYVGHTMLYATLYSALLLIAAALVFRKRDFL